MIWIIIIYIRLFGEAIHLCIEYCLAEVPGWASRYSKMAAKELKLLFDFRNVYRMKLPDINNNDNIDSTYFVRYKKILHSLEKYCTRLRLVSKCLRLVQYFSSSCNIFLYHTQCQSILYKYLSDKSSNISSAKLKLYTGSQRCCGNY